MENSGGKIMVVDDRPENLNLLGRMLVRTGYQVRPFQWAEAALASAILAPPDLVLLDIDMPKMNGFELCRAFKESENLREIPVIFISGLEDTEARVKAFKYGGVDFITKPFRLEEVRVRIETHLSLHRLQRELKAQNEQLEERVLKQVADISSAHMATIFALATLAEFRDNDTGRHIHRVSIYCQIIAARLHLEGLADEVDEQFIRNLYCAAPMHDIGKVAISDTILLKPGKLTDSEFDIIKTHTVLGAETLYHVHQRYPKNEFVQMGMAVARWHHEQWSGNGYPDGLEGAEIPLSARIMSVVDVYDALRSVRPYKSPMPHDKSKEIIIAQSGTHFDPMVVDAFLASEKELAELNLYQGEVGN
jgi:putative two-component system response regulator